MKEFPRNLRQDKLKKIVAEYQVKNKSLPTIKGIKKWNDFLMEILLDYEWRLTDKVLSHAFVVAENNGVDK